MIAKNVGPEGLQIYTADGMQSSKFATSVDPANPARHRGHQGHRAGRPHRRV